MVYDEHDDFPVSGESFLIDLGKNRMTKTSLSIQEDLLEEIQFSAKEQNISSSELLRRMIMLGNAIFKIINNGGSVFVQKEKGSVIGKLEIRED